MNEFRITTVTVMFDVGFGKFFSKKPAVLWYENVVSILYYIFMYFPKSYISITDLQYEDQNYMSIRYLHIKNHLSSIFTLTNDNSWMIFLWYVAIIYIVNLHY